MARVLPDVKRNLNVLKDNGFETDYDSRSGYRESGSRKKFRISNLKYEGLLDKDPGKTRRKKYEKVDDCWGRRTLRGSYLWY